MEDGGYLLGSDGKCDNTVTRMNMELGSVPDELGEILDFQTVMKCHLASHCL